MAFRFRRELANSIKKIALRNRLPQVRVLEILVTRYGKDLNPRILQSSRSPNCCEPLTPPSASSDGRGANGSEQNPQVPLASEDAFAQVPGNAETAVGLSFSSSFSSQIHADKAARSRISEGLLPILDASRTTPHAQS
jgi:hypothetical protein